MFERQIIASIHWMLVLVGAIMPLILAASLTIFVISLWQRSWLWGGLLTALILAEGGITASRTVGPYISHEALNADLSVVSFNMQANPQALRDLAAIAQDVDVIHLAEIPRRYADLIDFKTLFPSHKLYQQPYRQNLELEDGSLGILLKGEAKVQPLFESDGNHRTIFDVRLARQGHHIRLLATHPLLPLNHDYLTSRNGTLRRLQQLAAQEAQTPTILMGDMNTTPFEVDGWALPGKLVGNPLRISWSGIGNLLHIRIDHIRLRQGKGERLDVVGQRVGPALGSDHLPIFASFALKAK